MAVQFEIEIPESVAAKLREQDPDLARLSREKLVCSLYRDGKLSQAEAMRELGSLSRLAFEQMLSRHNLHRDWPAEEVQRELDAIDRLRERE